ncbi:hypothetical protein HPB47_023064 [Ixodes persulcatus]|uniref:Uncharacterized protein n=1 Tax=Ixodes persulcatus TaxID=34615 RepID=A0AC60Q7Z3_IXOPE|nr:hypothetical protein HPB47_023064 [Ixodes persulcatus]
MVAHDGGGRGSPLLFGGASWGSFERGMRPSRCSGRPQPPPPAAEPAARGPAARLPQGPVPRAGVGASSPFTGGPLPEATRGGSTSTEDIEASVNPHL